MANVGYVNKEVAKMYGIPYSELTPEQKKILHEDSVRRAKLIKEREEAVLKNNLKAFEDEAKMEKVLASIYASCQKEILASVTETISKVQKAGGEWSYANQSALTRSRGLFEQIGEQIKALGQKEQITVRQGLSNIYTDQFLRQVYDLGQSITVKANFNRLNPALIQKTLDYPWSGAMFSDRLWQDKERLGRNLRVGLTQSMILGEGIPQITDRINKGIDTARYNAERVARTETKRVTYCAHDDVYKDREFVDGVGIPIGNYVSQYDGNFNLSVVDHWLKEVKGVKYYFRYMDDMVIFGSSKEELHKLKRELDEFMAVNLKQVLKHNWQVFPTKVRGVDFVGYRFFGEYTLLRKSTCKTFKRRMLSISSKRENNVSPTYSKWCSFNSYVGWLQHCDSFRLYQKYVEPNVEYMHNYYLKEVKGNAEICKRKNYSGERKAS